MWLRILLMTLLLVQATRPAGFYVNCDDCGAEVHLGDDDTWGDDDDTTGDDDSSDDDVADDDTMGDDDSSDDDSADDDDTTPEGPWFTGDCEDDADNLFDSNCGLENTLAGWNFSTHNHEHEVVCGEDASTGDCHLDVWIDRTGLETDCTDGVDNDGDGDVDYDDVDCLPVEDEAWRVISESSLPSGAVCLFQADYRVDGLADYTFTLAFLNNNDLDTSATDDFDTLEVTATSSWESFWTEWTVNTETGTRRVVLAQFGDLPDEATLQIDNTWLVCE